MDTRWCALIGLFSHLSDDFHDLWWSRQFGYEELYLRALKATTCCHQLHRAHKEKAKYWVFDNSLTPHPHHAFSTMIKCFALNVRGLLTQNEDGTVLLQSTWYIKLLWPWPWSLSYFVNSSLLKVTFHLWTPYLLQNTSSYFHLRLIWPETSLVCQKNELFLPPQINV